MLGVEFIVNENETVHTFNTWELKWTKVVISQPKAKTYIVNVPFSNNNIDMTEVFGDITYNNRTITLEFDYIGKVNEWQTTYSDILNVLQGQNVKMILDTDKAFYWEGRLDINSTNDDYITNTVTITATVYPYKKERNNSLEPWLWDTFNFKNGIIRNYKDIVIDGYEIINIPNRREKIIPTFICNIDMQVIYNNKTYNLPSGETQILDIQLSEGDNILKFKGNGIVSIVYRGGSL